MLNNAKKYIINKNNFLFDQKNIIDKEYEKTYSLIKDDEDNEDKYELNELYNPKEEEEKEKEMIRYYLNDINKNKEKNNENIIDNINNNNKELINIIQINNNIIKSSIDEGINKLYIPLIKINEIIAKNNTIQENKIKDDELKSKQEEDKRRQEQERKERERKQKEEQEKRLKEEQERKERERKQKEEQEKRLKEEQERKERERKQKEEQERRLKEIENKKKADELRRKQEEDKRRQEQEKKLKEIEENKRRQEEEKRKAKEEKERKLKEEKEKKLKEKEEKERKLKEEKERKLKEEQEKKRKRQEEIINIKIQKFKDESNKKINKYKEKINNLTNFEIYKNLKDLLNGTLENVKNIDNKIIEKIEKNEEYDGLIKNREDLYITIDNIIKKRQSEIEERNKMLTEKAIKFKKEHEDSIKKMKETVNKYRDQNLDLDGLIEEFDDLIDGYKRDTETIFNNIKFDKEHEKDIGILIQKIDIIKNLIDAITNKYKLNKDKQEEERKLKEIEDKKKEEEKKKAEELKKKQEEEKKRKEIEDKKKQEEEKKRKEKEEENKQIEEKIKYSEDEIKNLKNLIEYNEINLDVENYVHFQNLFAKLCSLYTSMIVAYKGEKDINKGNNLYNEFNKELIDLKNKTSFLKRYADDDDVIMEDEYKENKPKKTEEEIEFDKLNDEFKNDIVELAKEKNNAALNRRKNKLLNDLFNRRLTEAEKFWSGDETLQEKLRQKKIHKNIQNKYVKEYQKNIDNKIKAMTDEEIKYANQYKQDIINNAYYGKKQPYIADLIYLSTFNAYKNDPEAILDRVNYIAKRLDEGVMKYVVRDYLNKNPNLKITKDDISFIRYIIYSQSYSNEQKDFFLDQFLSYFKDIKPKVMWKGSIGNKYLNAIINYRYDIMEKKLDDFIKKTNNEQYKKNYEKYKKEIDDILLEYDTDNNKEKKIMDILNK